MWRLGSQTAPAVRSHSALVMDEGLHQSRRQPWTKCLLNDEHELGSQALRRLDECVFHAFTKGDFEPFLDLCDPNTVLFSRSAADGETILMAAALHARLDLVHLFLDIGAFPWTETLGRHSPPKNAIAFAMMNPNAAIPGSPSAQIAALLQSQMPTFDSKGCVVDRTVLCKHPHESLAIDPEEGDLCCTACSLVMERRIVTLSMPNAETDGSVSNLDVPHRLTAKGAFQEQTSLGRNKEWVIRKHTEETEYASLDGGHTVVKETKVTISSPDGKHKYTYYENVDGEDEEDEDVSQDGSWEANLKAQCRRFRIKDNDKRWMDALANNIDAKRDRAVSFLRARWPGRKALAREQRKALGIENPVILLETENSETASQPALNSPRSSHVEMEEEASPRLDQSQEEASPCSPNQTESNMEYEFETA